MRQVAKQERVSIAELVRRGVDRLLSKLPIENDPAMQIVALGRSRKKDLARDHDRHLEETHKQERG